MRVGSNALLGESYGYAADFLKGDDGRTTRQKGYALSQRVPKRIEEIFGWAKTVEPAAKTMLREVERVALALINFERRHQKPKVL